MGDLIRNTLHSVGCKGTLASLPDGAFGPPLCRGLLCTSVKVEDNVKLEVPLYFIFCVHVTYFFLGMAFAALAALQGGPRLSLKCPVGSYALR